LWLDEEEARSRPELTLLVTRHDDEPPVRDPETGRRTVVITGQQRAPVQRRRPDAGPLRARCARPAATGDWL
jgi:hypothetical protein